MTLIQFARRLMLTVTLLVMNGEWTTAAFCQSVPAAESVQTDPPDETAIDFERARALLQKRQSGQKLTEAESSYLQRAMEARRRMQNAAGRREGSRGLSARETTGLKPLSDMSADDRYLDQDGGLYGQGLNIPPASHRAAAERRLAAIQPRDAAGEPADNGKVVLVSISMSNATQEFSRFKQLADADPLKSSQLTIVDCAQGGQAMAEWVDPKAAPWEEARRRLQRAQVTPNQVQIAWIKLANKGPSGDLATHGRKLQADTLAVIHNAKRLFPHLQVAYLSSRIYGGHSGGALNPEPYAYESAFPVRWLIQDQMAGKEELQFESEEVGKDAVAPLLLWGPYLWADGTTPRNSDHLTWPREDLGPDGTHPSQSGRTKVAGLLLDFFKQDPLTRSWFVKGARTQ